MRLALITRARRLAPVLRTASPMNRSVWPRTLQGLSTHHDVIARQEGALPPMLLVMAAIGPGLLVRWTLADGGKGRTLQPRVFVSLDSSRPVTIDTIDKKVLRAMFATGSKT